MGRAKLEIKKIAKVSGQHVTYGKRSKGLLKKSYELSVLCEALTLVVMFSPSGKLTSYCIPETETENVLQRFAKRSSHERKRTQEESSLHVAKIRRELEVERDGEDPVGTMPAAGEWRPAEQTEMDTKQWEINNLKSNLQQAQGKPLEDVIMAHIQRFAEQRSDIVAKMDHLEISITNGISKVHQKKHVVQSNERMRGQRQSQSFAPEPQNPTKVHTERSVGATDGPETSLPQNQSIPMRSDSPPLQSPRPMPHSETQSRAVPESVQVPNTVYQINYGPVFYQR